MFISKRRIERDPETIQMWKDRCKKLERENSKLRGELEAVKRYKEDYEDLIASVNFLKRRYEYLIDQAEELENSYKDELENILKIANENSEE